MMGGVWIALMRFSVVPSALLLVMLAVDKVSVGGWRLFGHVGYALFYAAGVVLSALPSYWRHRNDANYRSLGASGAVSAVLFAYILIKP